MTNVRLQPHLPGADELNIICTVPTILVQGESREFIIYISQIQNTMAVDVLAT